VFPAGSVSVLSDAGNQLTLHALNVPDSGFGIDLYWLPLGAGGHFVRLNGRMYEALTARVEHRRPDDLYHSALEVRVPDGRYVIEQAPIRESDGPDRGVVAEGPVGSRVLAGLRIFRYELRCWHDGVIPDLDEAVDSPRRLTDDPDAGRRLLDLAPHVPTPVWGRDEFRTGEMWNSNSFIAWLIDRGGLDAASIRPPAGGRAPGWQAGVVLSRRTSVTADPSGSGAGVAYPGIVAVWPPQVPPRSWSSSARLPRRS
jgi:hypothetical protein